MKIEPVHRILRTAETMDYTIYVRNKKRYLINFFNDKVHSETYFDHEEWDKFLFERGNQRLIKASEESNEIFRDNELEYRKCLKMIDAVNQNRYDQEINY